MCKKTVTKPFAVAFEVKGRYHANIDVPVELSDAEALQYALKHGNEMATDAEFGELEDIEWDVDHVEDDKDRYIYPNQ